MSACPGPHLALFTGDGCAVALRESGLDSLAPAAQSVSAIRPVQLLTVGVVGDSSLL